MIIIAHRAGTDRFPEQSMASIRHSLAMGADFAEVDIRFTSDGVPVICHDPNAARVFGVDEQINHLALDEFLALRHVSDHSISAYTLEQLFEARLFPLLLHYKDYTRENLVRVLELIRVHKMEEKLTMGMESVEAVAQVKAFDARMQVLAFMPRLEDLDSFLKTKADVIRLWEKWVTRERVDKIRAAGKSCWVMARQHEVVGYTDLANLDVWRALGVSGVLLDEMEPLRAWRNKKA